ncbi:MAG: tetratricopeptide repeat protein [Nitrospira sp. LK70]|nr:tetratricopeptide repeat protein [Nitrospira sp. LK70]
MKKPVQRLAILSIVLVLVGMTACAQKRKPLVPLALDGEVRSQATALTEQGTQAYQAKQFEEAKQYFEQAVAAAPQSGQAHYNYALALNALGDSELARQHFIAAADLAPGDKVIWDSPALSPYGNPESKDKAKMRPNMPRRSSFGGGMPSGGY